MDERFQHSKYLIRKQMLKLVGGAFRIYDMQENLMFYSNMKAFKLKEDIRIYTGEDMQTEVLTIKARKVLDISSAYDVWDTAKQEMVGVLKRKGLKSMIKDEWIIMDKNDNELGFIKEDSLLLATLRRWATNLIPQSYEADIQGKPVCTFKQNFNPFTLKIIADFSQDQTNLLDRRLGIAAAVLLCAIEGRQG